MTGRIDPDVGGLRRTDPGALDVPGDADPEVPPGFPFRVLPATKPPVVDGAQRMIEASEIIPAVEDDALPVTVRHPDVVGHLVVAERVDPPDLGRIHPQFARREIDHPLHREDRLRAACTTDRRRRRLVRDDGPAVDEQRRNAVRSGHVRRGVV